MRAFLLLKKKIFKRYFPFGEKYVIMIFTEVYLENYRRFYAE
jgi:hypothetical protein